MSTGTFKVRHFQKQQLVARKDFASATTMNSSKQIVIKEKNLEDDHKMTPGHAGAYVPLKNHTQQVLQPNDSQSNQDSAHLNPTADTKNGGMGLHAANNKVVICIVSFINHIQQLTIIFTLDFGAGQRRDHLAFCR